jgi:hypothetical protein
MVRAEKMENEDVPAGRDELDKHGLRDYAKT